MQLKRHFKDGKLDFVEVKKHSEKQKFTQKFINRGISEGFLTITQGKIILHTKPELTYKIVTVPGIYCCHDNKKMDSDKDAIKHIEENFNGVVSPDKSNVAGYRKDDFYQCELEK